MEKSKNSKNILIINDMPGYGKVALAAMLPILSNFGHSVYNLPTALVSNTLDYGKFTILDTTEYMKKSISVWKDLNFSFDCITTGFLASAEQVDIIRDFIDSQRKEDLLVMTDPIMADDGKLYNGVTEETVANMRRLIGVADVIVPNLTEATFLTGTGRYVGQESLTQAEAKEVVDGLLSFGPRSVVVTSGVESETGSHVVWGYNHKNGSYFTIPYEFIKVHFPGTGDMFSAVLVGELLNGKPLESAVRRAMDVLAGAGREREEQGHPHREVFERIEPVSQESRRRRHAAQRKSRYRRLSAAEKGPVCTGSGKTLYPPRGGDLSAGLLPEPAQGADFVRGNGDLQFP